MADNDAVRGFKEASRLFPDLNKRWPLAFPALEHEIRPLAHGVAAIVAAEMGWTYLYARSVLSVWKQRRSYCIAILSYQRRMNLDGSDSGVDVDDKARSHARATLDVIASRAKRKAEKRAKPKPVAADPVETSPAVSTAIETAADPIDRADVADPVEPIAAEPPRKIIGASGAMAMALASRLASGHVLTQAVATINPTAPARGRG
jgi:sRNA-binding protein